MSPAEMVLKRLFDCVGAAFGLVITALPCALIAFIIKVTSRGPVLFRQKRIGKCGQPISCVKFRTMYHGTDGQGTVTASDDSRITPLGRWLRRYKLDELPQLFNVFIGTMSFVGPRPDVPGYADRLSGDDRKILLVRPGITGPASLFFRFEEEILAGVEEKKTYNDTIIWPRKIKINREYIDRWSFWKDIGYILVTVFPWLNGIIKVCPESPRTPNQLSD